MRSVEDNIVSLRYQKKLCVSVMESFIWGGGFFNGGTSFVFFALSSLFKP